MRVRMSMRDSASRYANDARLHVSDEALAIFSQLMTKPMPTRRTLGARQVPIAEPNRVARSTAPPISGTHGAVHLTRHGESALGSSLSRV